METLLQHQFPFLCGIRRLLVALACAAPLLWTSAQPPADSVLVTQQIRYACDDAGEVFLVWGVNNWQVADSTFFPAGTYVRDRIVYTPMSRSSGFFTADLTLPRGYMLDYVFWITKGPKGTVADLWDKNAAPFTDYHSYAGNHHTLTINPSIEIRPDEPLSVLHYSWPLLFAVAGFSAAYLLLRRRFYFLRPRPGGFSSYIPAGGLSLFILLFLIRPSAAGISWDIYAWKDEALREWLASGVYDCIYAAAVTTLFLAFHFLLRKSPRLQLTVMLVFFMVAVMSVMVALLNIRVVQVLGKPFNYQWLYYSDFLQSPDSRSAIAANLSGGYAQRLVVVGLAGVMLAWLTAQAMRLASSPRGRMAVHAAFPCLGALYLLYAWHSPERRMLNYDRLANPIVAFIASVNPFSPAPALFTMNLPDSVEMKDPVALQTRERPFAMPEGISNVLVFVMESTPAEYLEVYGSKYKVTPELSKWSRNALVFDNVYAHAPATNLSLVALLGSIYPGLSYNSITEEHPDLDITTISSWLSMHGYRAGFFSSADNSFQRADEFLDGRGFGRISDCRSGVCSQTYSVESEWEHLDGRDERCTAEELCDWMAENPSRPFFGMMWTYQTHYPYFTRGNEKQYSTDPFFNRYLNALRYSDETFGYVMKRLKKMKALESTLVVVIGDHGEAFGRHDQITHGRKIYEENLHVPCLFIHPSFRDTRFAAVGGLVDVAPTITHLLGLATPEGWQGQSLFAANRSNRTYFFAPWSDYLFGYREDGLKYIYNASTNQTEIYDLARDPREEENLARALPEEAEKCHQRLAAWTQYVNKKMMTLLGRRRSIPLARN